MDFKKLDDLLKHFIEVGPCGCAVSVSLDGQVIYEQYEGYADQAKTIKLGPASLFRIFSNTKVFTMVALLKLYERGLFLLNDPLYAYMPEFSDMQEYCSTGNGVLQVEKAKRPIRIMDLLTMTSGLTYEGVATPTEQETKKVMDSLEAKGGYTVREFCYAISKVPLAFHPGTHWHYGYSHDVVGGLIEVLSGKSFGQFLNEEVFTPLGIKNTFFFLNKENEENLTHLYTPTISGLIENKEYEHMYKRDHMFESGGAGLLSTLQDTARLGQMLAMGGTLNGERILGRKTIDMMRRNHLTGDAMADFVATHSNGWDFLKGYGYGLGVRTLIDPVAGGWNGTPGEFAWAGAAGTYMLVDPEERLSVSYMQQLRPGNMEEYTTPRLRSVVYGML